MLTRASQHKAFTLIEVLIVVLILGILATFALPYFEGAQIKAKFARVFTITSRIEREMEYIIAEEGWGFASAATTKLNDVLANDTGLTPSGIYYIDAGGDFEYRCVSSPLAESPYLVLYIYTVQPSRADLCRRYYYKPGCPDANDHGERVWKIYSANPWSKYIRPLLQGPVWES